MYDVKVNMVSIFNKIDDIDINKKGEDNLFVKNIFVNKEKNQKKVVPFIATDKWVRQLGERLSIN